MSVRTESRSAARPVPARTPKKTLSLVSRHGVKLLVVAVLVAGFATPFLVRDVYLMSVAMDGVLMAVLAMSIGFLYRHVGLISLGQTAFYGAAAYGLAVTNERWGWSPLLAALAGIVVGVLLAVIVGLLVMRATGIAFLMLTLALGLATYELVVMDRMRELTGGHDGKLLNFASTDTFLGVSSAQLYDDFALWSVVWTVFAVTVVALWWIGRSRFGTVLHGIRENEERMRFSGFGTLLPRFAAFVIAGLVASVSGVLTALSNGLVTDQMLTFQTSGQALVSAIIGGLGTLLGPAFGAGLYTYLQSVFSGSGNLQLLTGLTLVIVLAILPKGIVGSVPDLARGTRRALSGILRRSR